MVDITVLVNEIETNIVEKEKTPYLDILEKILDSDTSNHKYIRDQMSRFVKMCIFKDMHYQTKDHYNSGEDTKAYDILNEKVSQINRVSFYEDDAVDFTNIDVILQGLMERNTFKIPTGMPVIDSYLLGGIPRQSVTTVMAGYNVGKTSFLINCSVEAAKKGFKTLFTYNEGRTEQIVARFLSKTARIPYNSIVSGHLDVEERIKIKKAAEFLHEYVLIKPMCFVGVTVEDVYDYSREVKEKFNYTLFVNDYGQDLLPKQTFKEERFNESRVWVTFDQMAHELDIAVLTAAQFNREGNKESREKTKITRSDKVSECIKIAQKSETIFTLNPNGDSRDSMIICLDKQRDGPIGVLLKVAMDMTRITTHDPMLPQDEITLQELEGDYSRVGSMIRNV
jgi:replicative DNA helicase